MKKSTKLLPLLIILFVFNLSSKAQWVILDEELSNQLDGMSAQASNGKAVLYGGNTPIGWMPTNMFHEFTPPSSPSTWTPGNEGGGRNQMASAALGDYLFFAGGFYEVQPTNEVNIYNTKTGIWNSTDTLSKWRGAFAGAATGTKALFAGGTNIDGVLFSTVDIYDTVSKQWTVSNLSHGRFDLCAAAIGNIIVFAGGASGDYTGDTAVFNTVDIYDVTANGGAGGWVTTSNDKLSVARTKCSAAAIGTKIYIAGGLTGVKALQAPSAVIDIYDVVTKQWTTHTLSKPRFRMGAAATSNYLMFAGGINTQKYSAMKVYNTVDMYDLTNNTWSNKDSLNISRATAGVFALNNEFYVAGGTSPSKLATAKIERLKVSGLGIRELNNEQPFALFPNPATNVIELKIDDIKEKGTVKIINSLGQMVYNNAIQANTLNTRINVENLPKGFYTVELSTNRARTIKKFIKE